MIDLKQMKGKEAVSPVIAVVLMIAVATSITIVIFAWASGFVGGRATAESPDAEQIFLEEMSRSGTSVTVYLRNMETSSIYLDTIYVNGQLRATNVSASISANGVSLLDLSALISANGGDGTFYVGDQVQLVTVNGTQIRFLVK